MHRKGAGTAAWLQARRFSVTGIYAVRESEEDNKKKKEIKKKGGDRTGDSDRDLPRKPTRDPKKQASD